MVLMGFPGARGTLIFEKNVKVKISCQTAFNKQLIDIFGYFHSLHYFISYCAADFSLLNLPWGKSLGRSKPAINS